MSLPIPARVINGLLRPKSPAGKLRRIFFEQDLYALLRKDRIKATKAIGLHRTFYVDPQALSRSLRWGGRGHNIISFSLDQVTAYPVSQFQTFKFFQEIIEEQRHYRDSALQAYFSDSKRYSARPGMRGEKASQPLSSDAEFEKYYLRCLRLVDSNQRRGVMDLRSSEGERFREQDAFDDNINVVIDGEGRIVHCRLGKHRLALRDCFVWIASGCGVGLSSYAPRERR